MSVRTDQVNLIVNINGNESQNKLNLLRKSAADIKFELEGMTRGTKAYIEKSKELKAVTGQIDELKKTIGLTSLNQKELMQELSKLKALKGSVVPFTKEFNDLQKQIELTEKRLYDVKNGVQGFSSFLSKLGSEVKQFGTLAAGYLGFQFITSQISNILTRSAKLSDQLADIRRVTGLSADEAERLNQKLSQLDTRTSTEGLRNIAIIAGKLGVEGVDNIFSFTQAVDKLVVALGDELGDADQITTELGKILNVFEGEVTGDKITKLGNAIVDLANKGVASGPFLVDFTQRVAAIAKTAGISLDAVLGLAAGLEESGAKVEASSTAIQKLISDIANDLPKAAKVAGMDVKEFNKLFSEQPQEALLRYAEGLQKNKQSFAEVAASFKDAGEEGARTVAVLATLGQKTDFFRQKMTDAGAAIKNTNEITDAFNLKNQSFGAELDKLGKTIGKWFANSAISSFFTDIVSGLNSLAEPTKTARQEFEELSVKVNHLEKDINPLINRYDELKSKTSLSKDEQAEMKIIINQIASDIPYAITQWDEYGNAIDISTGKAREFIEVQKSVMRVKNAEQIESTTKSIASMQKEIDYNNRWAETIRTNLTNQLKQWGDTEDKKIKMTEYANKTIASILQKNTPLQQQLIDQQNYLRSLNGELLDEHPKAQQEIKKTTDEVKTLNTEITKPEKNKEESKLNQLLKDARDFQRQMEQLKKDLQTKDASELEKQLSNAADKYQKLITKAQDYYTELSKLHGIEAESLKKAFASYLKELGLMSDQETNKILAAYAKNLPNQSFQEQKNNINSKYKVSDLDAQKGYANGDISKEQLLATLQQNKINRLREINELTQMSAAESTAAAAEAIQAEEDYTKALVEQRDTRDKDQAERDKAAEKKKAQDDKQAEKDDSRKRQAFEKTVDNYIGYGNALVNFFGAVDRIISNSEQRRLMQSEQMFNKEKSNLDLQLKRKLLSQEQYDKKLAELEKEKDDRTKKFEIAQAKRRKMLNIFQIAVDTASSVMRTYVEMGGWPLGLIPAGIMAGIGIAEGLAVKSEPLPSFGTGGLYENGPKHTDKEKGLVVVNPLTGKPESLVERGEAHIVAAAMDASDKMTVSGTARQIASAINSMYGGVSFDRGAVVDLNPRWQQVTPSFDAASVLKSFGSGGIYSGPSGGAAAAGGSAANDLVLQSILLEIKAQRNDMQNWKDKLKAYVVYRDLQDAQRLLDLSQKASALNQ